MSDIERLTDAQLVTAYLAGDRGAFAGIYDRYADRIFSYNLTMLRDREDAADATHDSFIEAATRMEQLRSPDELRPWLFSISRNEAHARGRDRARTTPENDLSETLVDEPDLAMGARQEELRELVWAAVDGLEERHQQLLALHLTEGLEGDDLARAMGVETSILGVMVSRMKDRVEESLGAHLMASLPEIMIVPAPVALRPRVLDKVDRGVAAVTGSPEPNPEWMKLGIFAVVTLVVGLVGLAVSAQFEPLELPPSVPTAGGPPVGGGSTTTTTTTPTDFTSTTAGDGGPSTSTTAARAPAAIEVSTDTVNFGGDGTVEAFDLTNTGGRTGEWTLVSSSDAIAVSAGSGAIGAGETVTIDLSLNRDEIGEGEISETLTITWAGGQISISVVGTHEANPIIHNPEASPPSVEVSGSPDCTNTQTTISARVRDASPLESVVVRWSPDRGNETETPMNSVGNDMFEGVIGPFTAVHTATVRIVAFDDRGNAGGATATVAVVACP